MPDTAAKSAYTPSWGKLKFVFYSTVCVLKKQPKNSHVFIALARELKKKKGISVNKSPFTHDVNFTVLLVAELHSNTKTNYLHPFLV